MQGTNSIYGSRQQISNGGIIFAISPSQGSTSAPLMSGELDIDSLCFCLAVNLFANLSAQGQPVLMQYLSPEGTPQQASIQYIQVLRPIMMVPAKPYQPPKAQNVDTQTPTFEPSYSKPQVQTTSLTSPSPASSSQPQQQQQQQYHQNQQQHQQQQQWSSFGSYTRQSPMGSYSTHMTSYNTRPAMNQRPSYDIGLNMNEYMPSASAHVSATVLAPRSSMISSFSPYTYKAPKFQAMAQRA